MSTSRIPPSSPLNDLVRALAATRAGRTGKVSRNGGASGSAIPADAARDLKVLRTRLSDLIGGLNADDEHAVLKARRPVVREILLWEFGSDFRQHPEFVPMLDTVERTLDTDRRFFDRFVRLIRDLQR